MNSYIVTLFKAWLIQYSGLFRVQFKTGLTVFAILVTMYLEG